MRKVNQWGRLCLVMLFVLVMLGSVGQVQAKKADVPEQALAVLLAYGDRTPDPNHVVYQDAKIHIEGEVYGGVWHLQIYDKNNQLVATIADGVILPDTYIPGGWVPHLRKVAQTIPPKP